MIRFTTLPFKLATVLALIAGFSTTVRADTTGSTWRAEMGKFTIGVVSNNHPNFERKRLQPLRFAIQRALSMPAKIAIYPNYETLIEAQLKSHVEYAIYSASAFATIWNQCKCTQPLVAPTASDGASGFRSVLLARQSKVSSLEDMKDKTILLPGRFSFAGYLFPRDQLAEQGIELEGSDWKVANRETMETTISDLLIGKGDGMFGWEPYYKNTPSSESQARGTQSMLGTDADQFHPVWKSAPVPFGPHTVRTDLDERAKLLLWDLMARLKQTNRAAFEAISFNYPGGFQPVTRAEYQPVIKFVQNSTRAVQAGKQIKK